MIRVGFSPHISLAMAGSGEKIMLGARVSLANSEGAWSFRYDFYSRDKPFVALSPCCAVEYSTTVMAEPACTSCGGPWAPRLPVKASLDGSVSVREWLLQAADWALPASPLELHVSVDRVYSVLMDWAREGGPQNVNNLRSYARAGAAHEEIERLQNRIQAETLLEDKG